ncbi:class I SAM-dependent methyltransferase [Polyangium sp. y55x31]|uniref:O-methyltransferase n=1 Tax=Polyangium sp. y55x31 TaxID=3042688 RepID=UPI00248308EE|nr:class I SAM-dependent methyltransferase [Polyangium sp. y55x31]MDI1476007.1 class I SAM-dependent methyltransferase [Polyangium sp. y55x31]
MKQLSWMDRLPEFGRSVVRQGLGVARDGATLRALSRAPHPRAQDIVSAVARLRAPLPPPERALLAKIEAERGRLAAREEPLIDGTLPSGPYDDRVTVQQACSVSKGKKSALFLYLLVRAFKPELVIELGTNVGISSSYLAAALQVNGRGRLVTLEASPYRIRCAKGVHERVGLGNVTYVQGLFTDTLETTLRELGTVDFAFIDGHHQYQPTLDYFGLIHRHATPDATYVFDDIRWSSGMLSAWDEIQRDERLSLSADLYSVGVCVAAGQERPARYASAPIYAALM